jgi:hypothetical protein
MQQPQQLRTYCLEIQAALLELGVDDVEIAVLNDERGNDTGGYDLRVSLDSFPNGLNGFLDRLLLSPVGSYLDSKGERKPIIRIKWELSDASWSAHADELLHQLSRDQQVQVIKRQHRRRELARIAHEAYANMNSTSDSPQAKA